MHIINLPHRATIVLPVLDKGGIPLPHEWLRDTLSAAFGGCTITAGDGAWIADNGRADNEPVRLFAVSSASPIHVEPIVAGLLFATDQDAIFFEQGGTSHVMSR
jgi:hypothetical protein